MMYNGDKRVVHAIKFQSVALPNGLITNLYGPVGKGLFTLLLFINKCQVYKKSIRAMKGWSHDTILQKRCMMKNNDIPWNKPNTFNFFFQRAKGMIRYAGRIWSLAWLGTPCIFDWGSASMNIWGSCISPQGSPARTIPRCCSHTSDGDVHGSMSSVRVSVEWLFGYILNILNSLILNRT